MTTEIHCPWCLKKRPGAAEYNAVVGEFWEARRAYDPCCNPECGGTWGTGCWHCHHPDYIARDLARRMSFMARRPVRFECAGDRVIVEEPGLTRATLDAQTALAARLLLELEFDSAMSDTLGTTLWDSVMWADPKNRYGQDMDAWNSVAVLADRIQAQGHPVGEWLALWQTRWVHGYTEGIGAAVYWLRSSP